MRLVRWHTVRRVTRAVVLLALLSLAAVWWASRKLQAVEGDERTKQQVTVTTDSFPYLPVEPFQDLQEQPLQDLQEEDEKKGQPPLILWWNPISGQRDFEVTCEGLTCAVTTDRSRWQEQEVTMLSFYGPDLSPHELPVPRRITDLWSLYHDESPKNLDFLFSHRDVINLFNYTATFRRTSHFPFPTQWLINDKDITNTDYVVPVQEKSRLRRTEKLAPVVYVQSDCSVPSDRDHLVTLLQRHVNVDSYGQCLNNRQFPHPGMSFKEAGNMKPMTSEEYFRFLSRYKFVIAVENAVCPDYITEKFWRPFHLGVVPIVFGSNTSRDFLPTNHSALLVEEFPSIESLGAAIRYYDEQDEKYDKLRTFKHGGGITNQFLLNHLKNRASKPTTQFRSTMVQDYHCFLCRHLHKAVTSHRLGKPIPKSVASQDHFGCPKPGSFNNEGRYIEGDANWMQSWQYSLYVTCAMRRLVQDRQIPQETFDRMARQIQRDAQYREHICAGIE